MSLNSTVDYDTIIVGGGPAGLAAAIALKKHSLKSGVERTVAVVEKGDYLGAHTCSGAVMDPSALDQHIPEWRQFIKDKQMSVVNHESFHFLSKTHSFPIPSPLIPPLMQTNCAVILSLGDLVIGLGKLAEQLGVDIYTGYTAADIIIEHDRICGIWLGAKGINRNGMPMPSYIQPTRLTSHWLCLAEGAKGSLTRKVQNHFGKDHNKLPQQYALGIKEVWKLEPKDFNPGSVEHYIGWPLGRAATGGGWCYHYGDRYLSIGLVTHLDYKNPYLSPFGEFQKFKQHPKLHAILARGERIAYGARAIASGGYQRIPNLIFPGACLVGDSAGFVNIANLKGIHNAVISGCLAADAIHNADVSVDQLTAYTESVYSSTLATELRKVQYVKTLLASFGMYAGSFLVGLELWFQSIFRRSLFPIKARPVSDRECTQCADGYQPIEYPKPNNTITFDRDASLYVSGTMHNEDQPSHILVKDRSLQLRSEYKRYAGLSTRYCPAGVFSWTSSKEDADPVYRIQSQNCLHCKTCEIKDPNNNLVWECPEGGGGPHYKGM